MERKQPRKYKLKEVLMVSLLGSHLNKDATYDEQFNSAVACTTAPFQEVLPERSIGHNIWIRNYDPERETAATGSTADIDPSTQEEETYNDLPPPFVPFQDNSPPLFSDEIKTGTEAPIDAPSARTRSKRSILDIPNK
eukprot:15072002-Ditylum_brightwellii.AAC.1